MGFFPSVVALLNINPPPTSNKKRTTAKRSGKFLEQGVIKICPGGGGEFRSLTRSRRLISCILAGTSTTQSPFSYRRPREKVLGGTTEGSKLSDKKRHLQHKGFCLKKSSGSP